MDEYIIQKKRIHTVFVIFRMKKKKFMIKKKSQMRSMMLNRVKNPERLTFDFISLK